jgi:hypothetical protein
MKKFTNNIENSKEKKIRTGSALPANSVNLAYFKVDEVTPGNSLTVVDSSSSIKENFIDYKNEQVSLLANEVGMLFDPLSGNSKFPSSDIYVTNYRNSQRNNTSYVDVNILNQNMIGENSVSDYIYSYYVSRYFTVKSLMSGSLVQKVFYNGKEYFDIIKTSEIQNIERKRDSIDLQDIMVLNPDGSEYVDLNGKKKYRVVLESYNEKQVSLSERLYKIIVLLEEPNPTNLFLSYPKIELDSDNYLVNQSLAYKENITPIQLFNEESEEASVVDYGSKYDNTYAVKSTESIQNKFSTGGVFDDRGYNIYVNKKAITDDRTYEVFSWRIVGKINRSFNYANRLEGLLGNSARSRGVVKAAVIKANTKTNYIDHHKIFTKLNLDSNPINIFNYLFKNPISEQAAIIPTSTDDSYWTVDLSAITHEQIKTFDFLILVVNSNTNIEQYQAKITTFLNNGGCLFVEFEGNPTLSVKSIYPIPVVDLVSGAATSVTYNRSTDAAQYPYSSINEYEDNRSWDIRSEVFDTGFGAYGKIAQTVSAFASSMSAYQSISTNVGPVLTVNKVGAIESGGVSAGTIISNTVSINSKAGTDYIQGGALPESLSVGTILLTSDAEGPLKVFYNSIIVGLISKYFTSGNSSNNSSSTLLTPVLMHATAWKTSWAINGPTSNDEYDYNDVLIKNDKLDEYAQFQINKDQNGDLYRTIDTMSYKEIFLQDFSKSVDNSYGQFYNSSNDVISYYIEFTNETIIPKNGTRLTTPLSSGITTPYYTYSIPTSEALGSPVVKTTTMSAPLNIPATFGQFYIKDRINSVTNNRGNQTSATNDVPFSYSYDFKTSYRAVRSTEASLAFDLSFRADFTLSLPITIKNFKLVYEKVGTRIKPKSDDPVDTPWQFARSKQSISVQSTFDVPITRLGRGMTNKYACVQDLINYKALHTIADGQAGNHFPYTGDIDLGNTYLQYSQGPKPGDRDTGPYVHYIQWTLKAAGYSVVTDGKLGSQTGTAIKSLQTKAGLAYIEAQVDSETKSAMAYVWCTKLHEGKVDDYKKQITDFYKRTPSIGAAVISYIEAAILSDPVGSAATGRIRRISYTGSDTKKTPDKLVCNLIVQIPDAVLDRTEKEDILSIKIYAGAADITISRIQFTKEVCSPTAGLTTFNTRRAAGAKEKDIIDLAYIKAGGAERIPLNMPNNPKDNQYKYVLIQASGSKLGGDFGPEAMRNVY